MPSPAPQAPLTAGLLVTRVRHVLHVLCLTTTNSTGPLTLCGETHMRMLGAQAVATGGSCCSGSPQSCGKTCKPLHSDDSLAWLQPRNARRERGLPYPEQV